MKDSQKKINEYKGRLPKLKEKVIAVALLLAVSATMLTTVSFAWLSLSASPEVTGVNTSIASNGNLEIALATGNPNAFFAPGESQVGDSNLALLERNLTWGNLINLSDPEYGLDQMVLRPALLNTFGLSSNPLYGPVYDEDGRVIRLNTNFGYSKWDSYMQRFNHSEELGVRSITSMTYGTSGAATQYSELLANIESKNGVLQTDYTALANNKSYMTALSSLIAGYMAEQIRNSTSSIAGMIKEPTLSRSNLQYLKSLYDDFSKLYEEQADIFAEFLNLQYQITKGENKTITGAEILAMEYKVDSKNVNNTIAAKKLINEGYTAASNGFIREIDQFIADYQTIVNDAVKIQGIIDNFTSNSVSWTNAKTADGITIGEIVGHLTDLNKCQIITPEGTVYSPGSIGGSAAMDLAGKKVEAIITNGILFNFDNRSGARLQANSVGMSINTSIPFMGTVSITADIHTSATSNYFGNELAELTQTIKDLHGAPSLIASDTYGLAIDFWVRTNAAGGYLTLQGNVLTVEKDVQVFGRDLTGKEVPIYTLSRMVTVAGTDPETGETVEQTVTTTYELYKLTAEDGTVTWYNAANHTVFELEEGETNDTPKEKWTVIEEVIGYEGDNRVWEGDEHISLTVNSTTQGSGSCYVYYADTPEDQARSLELLKYMRIAFIDANGTLLAEAYMDTDHHYAANGKVTVPMVLESDSINIGTDSEGNPRYAITALEQNVPTLITALVYLDGTDLTNDKVLSSANIQGQMNIQFGNSRLLHPIDNEKLYDSEMYVTAELDNTDFDFDTAAGDMITNVKVNIEGITPNNVTAFFIRSINAQTGAREEPFSLEYDESDGIWKAPYEFTYPGTYILRSIQIDGSDYELKIAEGEEFPTVTVKGFQIKSVTYSMNSTVMTVGSSYTGSVSLQFATNDAARMPNTVVGRFIREDGTTANVNFRYDTTTYTWNGNATFLSSGKYTMQYVVLDGQYVELAEAHRFTVDISLGMKVDVRSDTQTRIVMSPIEGYPEEIEMLVEILDDTGAELKELPGVSLNYSLRGSTAKKLYTALTWDSLLDCYIGKLVTTAGIWSFSDVKVQFGNSSNTLTKANGDAPVFTIIAPNPPEDTRNNYADRYQYLAGATGNYNTTDLSKITINGAVASVVLKYADAAQVYAKIERTDGTSVEIRYVLGVATPYDEANQETRFTFAIPEGQWKLTEVRAWDVYGDDPENPDVQKAYLWGEEYGISPTSLTEDQYMTGLLINVNDSEVAALYNVEVSISYDGVMINNNMIIFGKDENGDVVSEFLTSHSLTGKDVTVKFSDRYGLLNMIDANGNLAFTISDVSLDYLYALNGTDDATKVYGGYTTTNAFAKGKSLSSPKFTNSGTANLTTFIISDDSSLVFQHATQYEPGNLTFKIIPNGGVASDVPTTITNYGARKVEVYSLAPSVRITNTSNGNYTTNTATVQTTSESGCSGTTYTPPSVTITIDQMGYASTAKLIFTTNTGGNVQIFGSGDTQTDSFEWNNGTLTSNRTIGPKSNTSAGTLTATEITLTDNVGNSYTVKLDTNIVIEHSVA